MKPALPFKMPLIALTMSLSASVACAVPTSFTDLGSIGSAGTFTFDTIGSTITGQGDMDTDTALWAADGALLAQNDDIEGVDANGDPTIDLFSRIETPLSAGIYFIGIGEFGSFFEDNFLNEGPSLEAGEQANIVLNIAGTLVASGTLSGTSQRGETLFYQFSIDAPQPVPIPASMPLLLLACSGFAMARRRLN